MWCPNCDDDVAAEVTSDNQRILCASCGSDLGIAEKMPSTSKTREARELLKRWSTQSLLEPVVATGENRTGDESLSPGHIPVEPPSLINSEDERHETGDSEITTTEEPTVTSNSESETEQETEITESTQESLKSTGQVFRLDKAHSEAETLQPVEQEIPQNVTTEDPPEVKMKPKPADRSVRLHNAHQNVVPAPHFDVQAEIQNKQQQRKTNWASLGGQLLAYCGVGLITIGTTLVLRGYFGGTENYAATGWLVATAGQMLMFLGVITLVSGGLEQTTDEVSRHLEQIGNRLIRIEQKSLDQPLSGPNLPVESFSGQHSVSVKETVES